MMTEALRVLIVDNEPDFLETLSYWLRSKGYDVTQAGDGDTAVRLVKEGRQDVVFLDIVMPKIDGIETLRRIRTFNKKIPIILVTASVENENRFAGAKALGISGVFPKQGGLEQLGQVLGVALRMLKKSQSNAATSSQPPLGGFFQRFFQKVFPSSRS